MAKYLAVHDLVRISMAKYLAVHDLAGPRQVMHSEVLGQGSYTTGSATNSRHMVDYIVVLFKHCALFTVFLVHVHTT